MAKTHNLELEVFATYEVIMKYGILITHEKKSRSQGQMTSKRVPADCFVLTLNTVLSKGRLERHRAVVDGS